MNSDDGASFLDRAEHAVRGSYGRRSESETLFLERLLRELECNLYISGLSPAALFRAALQDRPFVDGARNVLEVFAIASQRPQRELRPGDWMLRAMPGTGDVGHISVLASGNLLMPSALTAAGIAAESQQAGYYGLVVEAGAFPHTRSRPFARRLLDSRGNVPPHTVFLRPRYCSTSVIADIPTEPEPLETWSAAQESVGEEAPNPFPAHPAASAALITPGCPDDAQLKQPLQLSEHCLNHLEGIHVAVVGGGLAGLMAARRLREHRVRVTLFEARGKVGGRVLSSDTFSNGRITEFGAELIGSFHTTWLALARHYGLAMISRMSEELYERSGLSTKLTLDKPLCMDEIRSLDEQMETRALRPIAVLAQQIVDPSQPWKQVVALRAFDITVAKALETYCKIDRLKDQRLWKMIEHLLVNDEVAPLDEMNFLGLLCKVKAGQGPRFGTKDSNLMGYWTELEIFRCADGCEALATNMAKEIQADEGKTRQKVQFQLRTAVKGIDISKQGVTLRVQQVQSNLKLADGAPIPIKQLYDFVVLTIPPSVWDGVTVKVDGKEASLKTEIGVMGMGPAVKFFSDVKSRFWIQEKAAPYGGSLELGQVWEGTDNQTRVDSQGVVLSVFAGPIVGRKRVPTKDECLAGLKRLYPGYGSNLTKPPHYADWPNEPFIKTGYASPLSGQVLGIGKKLSEPFHDRIFFAGEHTQMNFFGYMEGALRSGERAAETIINQECGLNKAPERFVASRETFAGASK